MVQRDLSTQWLAKEQGRERKMDLDQDNMSLRRKRTALSGLLEPVKEQSTKEVRHQDQASMMQELQKKHQLMDLEVLREIS